MLRYDEKELLARLNGLLPILQSTFAAACAQRVAPAYPRYAREAHPESVESLRAIQDRLWRDLAGEPMSATELTSKAALAESLQPPEDEPEIPEKKYAEDAAAALAYALRSRKTGDPQEAAWAARRTIEALDSFIIEAQGIQVGTRDAEERIVSDPLMQSELQRQRPDLDDLLSLGASEAGTLVAKVRRRAQAESVSFFGQTS